MPLIFLSSVPFGGGERVARQLAAKLGCAYMSREDVVARANEYGIPVGKLEVAMVKQPAVQERLARLKERYLAVATAVLCEKANEECLVYYGRAGHHLLHGVQHVLRVHIVPDEAQRLETASQRVKLPPEKAEKFLKSIDEDIRAWVRFVHGADMDDPRRYDYVVNLERTSIENAATALCTIAQLPDYRSTPASRRAMADRLLQARARIRLLLDERLSEADLTVRATEGVVTVTYMPRQAALAPLIPEIVGELPGCREVRCTMASSNVLWIQEQFRGGAEAYAHVTELARRWGAAVELLRYRPEGTGTIEEMGAGGAPVGPQRRADGGVEEDTPVPQEKGEELEFRKTLEALVGEGRSGGGQTVSGPRESVLQAINPTIPYSLVVVGDLYADKPPAARTRLTREFASFLGQNMKAPVVSAADLGERLRVGPKQVARFAASILLVAALYALVFLNQETFVQLLGGDVHKAKPWLAPLVIAILAPVVAALYGQVAGFFLKLFKFE